MSDLSKSIMLGWQAAETAPAVFVVPADLNLGCVDQAPPILKLCPRNIKRSGCNEMVKDYGVLLAPAESSDRVQIIIVEQSLGNCSSSRNTIHWPVKQLCGCVKRGR